MQILGESLRHRSAPDVMARSMRPTVPAHEVGLHLHADAHLILVTAGRYTSGAEGAEAVAPGELLALFNPPGTKHRDCFSAGQDLGAAHFYSICIGAGTWHEFSRSLTLPASPVALVHRDALGMLTRLAPLFRRHDVTPLDLECLLAHTLGDLSAREGEALGAAPGWLARAREELRENWREALAPSGLACLARNHGVHPVYLARAFRHILRCTPGDFARQCRLEHAAALLANSRHTLAEIALDCGFFDQAHFTRAFAAARGHTPRQYRERLQPYKTLSRCRP